MSGAIDAADRKHFIQDIDILYTSLKLMTPLVRSSRWLGCFPVCIYSFGQFNDGNT